MASTGRAGWAGCAVWAERHGRAVGFAGWADWAGRAGAELGLLGFGLTCIERFRKRRPRFINLQLNILYSLQHAPQRHRAFRRAGVVCLSVFRLGDPRRVVGDSVKIFQCCFPLPNIRDPG